MIHIKSSPSYPLYNIEIENTFFSTTSTWIGRPVSVYNFYQHPATNRLKRQDLFPNKNIQDLNIDGNLKKHMNYLFIWHNLLRTKTLLFINGEKHQLWSQLCNYFCTALAAFVTQKFDRLNIVFCIKAFNKHMEHWTKCEFQFRIFYLKSLMYSHYISRINGPAIFESLLTRKPSKPI